MRGSLLTIWVLRFHSYCTNGYNEMVNIQNFLLPLCTNGYICLLNDQNHLKKRSDGSVYIEMCSVFEVSIRDGKIIYEHCRILGFFSSHLLFVIRQFWSDPLPSPWSHHPATAAAETTPFKWRHELHRRHSGPLHHGWTEGMPLRAAATSLLQRTPSPSCSGCGWRPLYKVRTPPKSCMANPHSQHSLLANVPPV